MTLGLSPKAVLAFLFPLIASLAGALVSWIATGNFNDAEIRASLGGVITSGLALVGAYVGHPGDVVQPPVGTPSDDLLSQDAKRKLDELL